MATNNGCSQGTRIDAIRIGRAIAAVIILDIQEDGWDFERLPLDCFSVTNTPHLQKRAAGLLKVSCEIHHLQLRKSPREPLVVTVAVDNRNNLFGVTLIVKGK